MFSTLFGKLIGRKRRMLAAGLSAAGILFYTILVGAGASVIDTAELSGIRAFDAIQFLFGSPSLPIPLGGE